MIKKILQILLIAVLVCAAVAGCSNTKANTEPQVKEITLCESWDFEKGFSTVITPEVSSNFGLSFYLSNFYETLVNYDNGKIIPGLAESWSVSKDGLVYTFNLKKGVKFSDGTDFNASVVKRNLEMVPKLSGAYVASFAYVASIFNQVKAINDFTVEAHFTKPYYGTLHDFTKLNPLAMMSPKAFNDDDTLSEGILTTTMGTGPYMFDSKNDTNSYTFVQNPNYHAKKPSVEKFHVKVIKDNEAKALALRNGEIDLIFGTGKLSYDSFKEFTNDKGFGTKVSDTSIKSRFLGFNLQKEPFNNKDLRLSVAHAIEKQDVCDNLLYGIEKKSETFFSKDLSYCNVLVEPIDYDLNKATQLLDKAGWKDKNGDGIREKNGKDLEVELLYPSGMGSVDDLALTFSSMLGKIGMNVKLTGLDWMAWYVKIQEGAYSIVYKETYDIPFDPFTSITNMNSDTKVDYALVQGLSHLKNANQLIMELNSLVDESTIQEKYNYLLSEIHNNVAFVPISEMKELIVYNASKISDYKFYGQPSTVDIAGIKLK